MLKIAWTMLKETIRSFIDDDALSRGASMAFYAFTSLAPILLIVVAIAGIVFGEDAARNALAGQFEALMGQQSAACCKAPSRMPGENHPAFWPRSSAW